MGPDDAGPFECVMFILSKALMWKPGASCATARKILFLDASRVHCQAEATSEMAIELLPPRTIGRKWQRMIVDSGVVIGRWSPAIVCCRERELCGFVHGDDFIITGDSMPLAWIESRFNKGLVLKRRAILGLDDGDDKAATVLGPW